jgi:hypothetical protein
MKMISNPPPRNLPALMIGRGWLGPQLWGQDGVAAINSYLRSRKRWTQQADPLPPSPLQRRAGGEQ